MSCRIISKNTIQKVLSPLSSRLSSTSISSELSKPAISEERKKTIRRREYRFAYPEFLPDCEPKFRNHTRELLERRDMIARRENVMIPEFYVGSIVGVTITNPPSQGPGNMSFYFQTWYYIRGVIRISNPQVPVSYFVPKSRPQIAFLLRFQAFLQNQRVPKDMSSKLTCARHPWHPF